MYPHAFGKYPHTPNMYRVQLLFIISLGIQGNDILSGKYSYYIWAQYRYGQYI